MTTVGHPRQGDEVFGDEVIIARAISASRATERKASWTVRVWWLALSTLFLLAWQLGSGTIIDPFWVSSPARIGQRLWAWTISGELWPHLSTTVLEALSGFVVGALLSLAVGLTLGMSPIAYRVLSPFLTALYALPKITLGPLLILYFGIGFEMKFVLSAIITFFGPIHRSDDCIL